MRCEKGEPWVGSLIWPQILLISKLISITYEPMSTKPQPSLRSCLTRKGWSLLASSFFSFKVPSLETQMKFFVLVMILNIFVNTLPMSIKDRKPMFKQAQPFIWRINIINISSCRFAQRWACKPLLITSCLDNSETSIEAFRKALKQIRFIRRHENFSSYFQ